jgi:hypothetical protein
MEFRQLDVGPPCRAGELQLVVGGIPHLNRKVMTVAAHTSPKQPPVELPAARRSPVGYIRGPSGFEPFLDSGTTLVR